MGSYHCLFIVLIASWIVGIAACIVQKRINEAKQRENFFVLYYKFKKSNKKRILAEDITKTPGELAKEFKKIQRNITSALINGNLDKATFLADKYEEIVNAIAKKKENTVTTDLQTEKLTLKNIVRLHCSLFPQNYELAGKIRKVSVCIEGEENSDQPRLMPPSAEKVPILLKNILLWWRDKSKKLLNSAKEEKIDAISQFHHQFLVIHPFLDGNGRMARLLLGLQLKEQFQKDIKIEFPKKEYYKALSLADKRDKTKLNDLISKLLDKKSGFE